MNVGDFVRTKSNGIQKIDKEGRINLGLIKPHFSIIKKEELLKTSPQIIDLIQCGDYVNGYYVEDITHNSEEYVLHIITGSNYFQNPLIYNEDIKTIVTHEQMEAMQYRVEE